MDKTPVPKDIKAIIDNKINLAIVAALSMIPEAFELSKGLATITSYEDYQQYLSKLNQYKVITNGIGEYITTAQQVTRKSSISERNSIHYSREVEELTRNIIGADSEKGIVHIDTQIPFETILEYARNIWIDHQKLIFVQPNNSSISGKITAEAWRGKKKLPVLRGWSRRVEDATQREVTFYTQRMLDRKTWDEESVLTQEVYGYRLWDDENHREFLILSEMEIGEDGRSGVYHGFLVEKAENVIVGDDLKIGAYANLFHIHNFTREVQGIQGMVEYPQGFQTNVTDVRIDVRVDHKSMVIMALENAIFNKYKHPQWFMNTYLYFLLSSPLFEYPPHLFIFQDGSGGKTTVLQHTADTMAIPRTDIWSGNKSTLKSLIPSFHTNPPQIGWMSLQRTIGLLDEFFGRQSTKESEVRLEDYSNLKDMLDRNQSASLSGKGSVVTYSTAKFVFCSNLKYGIKDLESFMNRTDAAFVERMLVYFMNKEHENFIRENREKVMELPDEPEVFPGSMKFIKHLILHANSFKISDIDYKRIKKIRESLVTSNTLDMSKTAAIEDYVNARMTHHLVCLLDGIVKYRLFSNMVYEGDFTPVEEDYLELESVSEIISRSWMNNFNITDFSLAARVRLLRGNPREMYHFVREQGGSVLENDYLVYVNEVLKLDPKVAGQATNTLLQWGVLVQDSGYFKCYWRDEVKELKRPTIKTNEIVIDEKGNYGVILELIRDSPGLTFEDLKEDFADARRILDELERKGKVYRPDGKGYILHGGQVKI